MLPRDTEVDQRKHANSLFFLKKEDEWRFQIKKVETVDYPEIQKRIENGEPVLMPPERNGETMLASERVLRQRFKKGAAEPWYFIHE